MKIINAIHAQTVGGVDSMFCNYAKAMIKSNHQVALLMSDNKNSDYLIDGVTKLYKLKNFSQIFDFIHLFWILIFFRPDLIICHSNRIMKWMKILKKFTKIKAVAVNHGISFKNSLCCDYIININQEIAKLVEKNNFDSDKNFVLPNAIENNQKFVKKEIKTKPVIGIYGRFEPRKGFDILIKACGILIEKKYDFTLKIGGFSSDSNYNLDHIKNLAKENNILEKCNFVGLVKDKDSFFLDVDIFCVPSREEPFGLVILEGFLHSTLVISSNTDGGKFLIEDNQNGILFENENVANLAEKIENIFLKKINYSLLTNKAFLTVKEKFSFESFQANLNQILQKIKSHRC
jgi:glycosyltransferase involved in cell wall biosynthesis